MRALLGTAYAGAMPVAVRVIPCLDVDAGRVVKGVNFVDLRDAGDPVEQTLSRHKGVERKVAYVCYTSESKTRSALLLL